LLSVPLDVFLAAKLVGAWLVVLLLLAGAVGAWLVILILRQTSRGFRDNNSVARFHGGLVFRHFATLYVVRWNDVTEVYANIQDAVINDHYFGTDYFYSLTMADGRRVKFLGISATKAGLNLARVLNQAVAREVTARLLPTMLATIRAGGVVDFGAVTAQLDGIHTPADVVPGPRPMRFGGIATRCGSGYRGLAYSAAGGGSATSAPSATFRCYGSSCVWDRRR
jgi:hypothetical protein